MANEDVTVRLRLARAKQFQQDAGKSGKSIRVLGKEVSTTSRKARLFSGTMSKTSGALGRGVRSAAGYVTAIAAIGGAAKSVHTTETFTHQVIALNRQFGLSVEAASRWAGALSARGLDTKQFSVALVKNSRMVESATQGYQKQQKAIDALGSTDKDHIKRQVLLAKGAGTQATLFKSLGITEKDLGRGRKDLNWLLNREVGALDRVQSATKRNAIAQQLWGRGWTKLRPLLGNGNKALQAQLKLADKYGVTLHGKTVKSVEDLIAAQHEAKYASLGLQLTLGQYLIPVVTKVTQFVTKLLYNIRSGNGQWAVWRQRIASVTAWLRQHQSVVRAVVIAVGGLAIFVKVALWTAKVATAMKILNATFLTNPIFLAIAAVVALGIAFVIAYKKIGWFHRAVDSVFSFIRRWGPTFLAPMTLGMSLVIPKLIKNFDRIVNFVKRLPGRIAGAASGLWDGLKSGLVSALNWIIDQINKVIGVKILGHQIGAKLGHIDVGGGGGGGGSSPSPGAGNKGATTGGHGPGGRTRAATAVPRAAIAGFSPNVSVFIGGEDFTNHVTRKVVTNAKNKARRR